MTTIVLPLPTVTGGGGLVIYTNPAALPGSAPTGTTVAVASDSTVRQWNGSAWVIVGDDTVVTIVNNTNSIGLTLTANTLSADTLLSTNAAAAGSRLVNTNIESTGSLGLRAQITDANIRLASTATAPITYTAGVIAIPLATNAVDGYLAATDRTSFAAKVDSTRAINTTAPLTGGGDLSANRTLSIPAATGSADGYLAATDFATFNAKVSATRAINTTAPLTGGGDLSANRTLSIPASTGAVDGYLAAVDFTTFAAKQSAITVTAPGAGNANGLQLSAGNLNVHLATSTQPGVVSIAAQTLAGDKTFAGNIIVTANTSNNSFSGVTDASSAGTAATNLQTATFTIGANAHHFVIEVGTENAQISCSSDQASSVVSFFSDSQNLALSSDAGTGVYVFKSAASNVISVKNRLGGTRTIRVRVLNSVVTAATVWA